jgi:flagellar biosynthetic protein FlhB
MKAPKIVAKGQRLMAARIRDLARRNGVPIIEDVPLARALFPRPLGAEVPAHLYKAVARILVLVARIRAGKAQPISRRRPAPPATRLPTWFEGTAR